MCCPQNRSFAFRRMLNIFKIELHKLGVDSDQAHSPIKLLRELLSIMIKPSFLELSRPSFLELSSEEQLEIKSRFAWILHDPILDVTPSLINLGFDGFYDELFIIDAVPAIQVFFTILTSNILANNNTLCALVGQLELKIGKLYFQEHMKLWISYVKGMTAVAGEIIAYSQIRMLFGGDSDKKIQAQQIIDKIKEKLSAVQAEMEKSNYPIEPLKSLLVCSRKTTGPTNHFHLMRVHRHQPL